MASSENQQLTASSNMFALNLYQDLRKDGENLIVSPIGLQILLAMALEGANGKTETEIASVLHHSKNDENILKGYNSMMNGLQDRALNIATRLFAEKRFKIKPTFLSLSSKYFLSDIKGEDFEGNPDGSRININNWAEEKTNHKIKDLLPPGSVTKDTRLVMVNAIHFKANWKKSFDRKNTVDMPFYVTPDHSVDVPMMVKREAKFRYMESQKLGAKILELPYEGDMFSMFIILPDKLDGLSKMENKLKSVNLNEEFASLYEQTVNVMVPRFKIEKTLDLNDVLMKTIPSAFRGANFSGIADEPLEISKVLQKAFIEVNEEGTEAAAATAFLIVFLIGYSESEVQDLHTFNQVTNKFAWDLYKEVKQPSGNTIVSPIALQLLLAILLQCTNGTTAAEIANVLQHKADDKSILNAYKHILQMKNNKNEINTFKSAAAIVVDQSFPLLEVNHIEEDLNEYLQAEILRQNFKGNPENSRSGINSWVHDYSGGEIRTILPEGSIDASTEAVMISAAVFKGAWKQKFDKKNTKIESFQIQPNVSVNVKMMGLTGGRFRYAWNSKFGAQIVELPYSEEEFRMIVILPETGLSELETKLTHENLFELINSVKETNVDIFLPRFKAKKSIKLVNVLKKMGMVTAFSRHADFSKMTNSSIAVSSVIQRAMIMVNEKGTRAAAASGIIISAKTLPPQMVCNSPFMYLILKGDTILFIGNFLKPLPS
nr:serpin B4 isoform X3 [Halyomorpha halys]